MKDISHGTVSLVRTGSPVYIPHLNGCILKRRACLFCVGSGLVGKYLYIDIDLGQLLLYKHSALLLDGGVINDQLYVKAIFKSSFFHKGLCLFQIRLVRSLLSIEADRIGENGGGLFCIAVEYDLCVCLTVKCIVECLTDSLVRKRLSSVRKGPLGVQSYVSVCSCRCHVDDDGRIVFDLADICGGYRENHVSLASLQHSDTGCILRNHLEGQAVYGRAFLPVVFVAHHLGVAAVYSLRKYERACTSRVLCKIVAGVLHSHSLGRNDTELGDLVDECIVGFF